jgi:uncharacterized membrane protein
VQENTVTFGDEVMLTTFGIVWSADGAGAHTPGSDAASCGCRGAIGTRSSSRDESRHETGINP